MLKTSSAIFSCAVCGTSQSGRSIVQLSEGCLKACTKCCSWTYLPRPTGTAQAAIHDTGAYFEHPYFQLRRSIGPQQVRRCRLVFSHLAKAVDISSLRGARMLDVGCDTGGFLVTAAAQFGIIPVGVDVSRMAVGAAAQRGVEVYCTTIEDAPASLTGFALITVIDLIEHVSDPGGFLQNVFRRLQPGGVVYLETPNIQSAVYAAGRMVSLIIRGRKNETLERIFPAQHIQYFTEGGLASLARDCGFEIPWQGNRALPAADISASHPVRAGVAALQMVDRLTRHGILICTVLKRPR
jgi:SAM-dependent methyltransferase